MRTAFLMTALTVLLVLVGDYFGGARGMMMMLIISLAMNLFSYWNSDKLVLAQYNAKQVDEKSAPALYKMVQRLAERGNLPMPKVYIIDSPVPNAFATGRNPEHAAVAVTTALTWCWSSLPRRCWSCWYRFCRPSAQSWPSSAISASRGDLREPRFNIFFKLA